MTRTMLLACRLFLLLPAIAACSQSARADELPELSDGNRFAELPVVLKDDKGQPVAAAELRPYGMQMKERRGHGYWDWRVFGPPKTVISDKQGRAVIRYPYRVRFNQELLTAKVVTFEVNHAEFVRKTVHFDLGSAVAEVTLKRGCELVLSAVDPESKPVKDFGVLIAGPYQPSAWTSTPEGARRTASLSDGKWQTMLVKLQEDGPTLFSGVLPLRVRPEQATRFQRVPLRPGAPVRGVLSDNVPRPIKGKILARSIPNPVNDSYQDDDPSLVWNEWGEVDPDGSFEFTSLPRGGLLQVIVICDGWISKTIDRDDVDFKGKNFFVMGQLFDVIGAELSIKVQMEPTGTVEATLKTADGKPFTKGRLTAWPNQKYFKGGSSVLGMRFDSSQRIRNQSLPPEKRIIPDWNSFDYPFMREPDKDGRVVLTGLPIGGMQSLYLEHNEFRLKAAPPAERGAVLFQLDSPAPKKLELTVVTD